MQPASLSKSAEAECQSVHVEPSTVQRDWSRRGLTNATWMGHSNGEKFFKLLADNGSSQETGLNTFVMNDRPGMNSRAKLMKNVIKSTVRMGSGEIPQCG